MLHLGSIVQVEAHWSVFASAGIAKVLRAVSAMVSAYRQSFADIECSTEQHSL